MLSKKQWSTRDSAGRMQITTLKVFNPLQIYPADEKATRIVQLLQYLINMITVVSPVLGVISFLFSYFFSNHYFKCTSQVRKNSQIYTDKLGRATLQREKTSTTLSIRGYSCSTTVVFSSSASSSCSDISQ